MRSVKGLLVMLPLLLLAGCAYKHTSYVNTDITKENWQSEVHISPDAWARGADRWFLTGEPNQAEEAARNAPYSERISTMTVRVPDTFSKIHVQGSFQVQLYGSELHNSVYIYGPNDDVRETEIRVKKDTLYIRQPEDSDRAVPEVIVRVGVMNLRELVQSGPGMVEGRLVRSDGLRLVSKGSGPVYLSGSLKVETIRSMGSGSINVFGASTPALRIKTSGSGCVNVSGRMGVYSIIHHGRGDINLIGVNSSVLKVFADGRGKVGLNGRFAVSDIAAYDDVSVFGYHVQSNRLTVHVADHARVGLAGVTGALDVTTTHAGDFEGRRLHVLDAYVRAKNDSHINVAASNRLFATATHNASVYYFGKPKLLSTFVDSNGVILPIEANDPPQGFSTYRPYKDSVFPGSAD